MVRAKNKKNDTVAPTLYYEFMGANTSTVNSDLKNGWYGPDSLFLGYKKVDVATNLGLLYIDNGIKEQQYSDTVDILKGIYTGSLRTGISDFIYNDKHHVSSVTMGPVNATRDTALTNRISAATKAIWDHINTYRQPVVIVVDLNKQTSGSGVLTSTIRPALHYIVVKGLREVNSIRYFSVYDPWQFLDKLEYTEENLLKLKALPSNTKPEWVYDYGIENVNPKWGIPAYILKVQGD
jgi:hypothetical protein